MQMNRKPNLDEDKILNEFGRDLVEEVKNNKIDPVIGRDEEIRRLIRILSRKTKNNPVLLGEPGVGKTAVVEGLAWRIFNNDVPESLKNHQVYELDIASLIAGAMYQGEFEDRLKKVLKKIKDSNGQIILFIDEIHTLVGAGRTQGSLDASNMLKPMLARGELHCVGATTLNEYQKYIENDQALERRFQKVMVEEPTVEDTISILRGLKDRFESHHGVSIADSAIVSAATLSKRYISDRFLPDKAIDLVDEACATIRTEIDSLPQDLDSLNRKILQLKIEETSLKKEKDETSKKRLEKVKQELNDLEAEQKVLNETWQSEKLLLNKQKELKKELETAKLSLEKALNDYDYEKASILQNSKIPSLENQLKEDTKTSLISEKVEEKEITEIISKWTKIPLTRLLKGEREKLLSLEDDLKKSVIGQDDAISRVSAALIRARAGIKDPNRPIGSFIFLGKTGVGKTELARSLALNLFDDKQAMIRLDMSEYMEKHSVARLIGAPPGYVGYDEGGQLSEAVRRKPYSIVLFDEIEKANKEVLNVLLQILDEGRITDGKGRLVDFKNTIIIMTSNLGSEYINDEDTNEEQVNESLRANFRPEFINRIDEVIIFKTLQEDVIGLVIDKFIGEVNSLLEESEITISLTDEAKKFIKNSAYDPVYGARPIKRFIMKNIETILAKKIIKEEINFKDNCLVDLENNQLIIKKV